MVSGLIKMNHTMLSIQIDTKSHQFNIKLSFFTSHMKRLLDTLE